MLKNCLTFFCILASWYVSSQGLAPYITTNGIVDFSSDAPLELIRASSNELHGVIAPVENTFSFGIEIISFRGFNNPMQLAHFNENHLESDRFRSATFKGKIIEDVDLNEDGLYLIRAKGILEIHGVKQERTIKSTVRVEDGKVQVHSRFTVLLDEHGIRLPKIVFQKIAREIVVEVNATFIKPKS